MQAAADTEPSAMISVIGLDADKVGTFAASKHLLFQLCEKICFQNIVFATCFQWNHDVFNCHLEMPSSIILISYLGHCWLDLNPVACRLNSGFFPIVSFSFISRLLEFRSTCTATSAYSSKGYCQDISILKPSFTIAKCSRVHTLQQWPQLSSIGFLTSRWPPPSYWRLWFACPFSAPKMWGNGQLFLFETEETSWFGPQYLPGALQRSHDG